MKPQIHGPTGCAQEWWGSLQMLLCIVHHLWKADEDKEGAWRLEESWGRILYINISRESARTMRPDLFWWSSVIRQEAMGTNWNFFLQTQKEVTKVVRRFLLNTREESKGEHQTDTPLPLPPVSMDLTSPPKDFLCCSSPAAQRKSGPLLPSP